ncbi:MAG: serine/threonine-protein phosphatase [Butyrivibrio sp.]|nr:serine/threonine-protein phosphatase [Butyrivibrio sp.]
MIDYYSFSAKGDRNSNEDFCLIKENSYGVCFVVNDGLGGCGNGDVASKLVATAIADSFDECIKDDFFKSSFIYASKLLSEKQRDTPMATNMKTTSAVLTIINNTAQWGHIGDSRIYYFNKARLLTRTYDHSVPQMLVKMKEIKEKDVRFHKDRSKLLKAIGDGSTNHEPSVSEKHSLVVGNAFLLCTDGFWELINEKEMTKALKKTKTAKEWIEYMASLVMSRGKGQDMDNASAIGVRIL